MSAAARPGARSGARRVAEGSKASSERRGILLAGGANTRLYPATLAVAKSLLPVYDKPLIYYSLSTLMLAGVRRILVITAPDRQEAHQRLLEDGEAWGMQFEYVAQDKPRGIADAFRLGRDFIGGKPSALALADNLFYGSGFAATLRQASEQTEGATVFACRVLDPKNFGVVSFDKKGRAKTLEEKPKKPKSSFAVTGMYFYDSDACDLAAGLTPSQRGELEITDLNREYMKRKKLHVRHIGRGSAWFDTGTPDTLAEAVNFVRVVQSRQALMIACVEEIAWRNGWIDDDDLGRLANKLGKTPYGQYVRSLPSTDRGMP